MIPAALLFGFLAVFAVYEWWRLRRKRRFVRRVME